MDVRIETDGRNGDLLSLFAWLRNTSELRGWVSIVHAPIAEQQLGSIPDSLSVVLGAGGAGTVLASSLKVWLQTLRNSAKITISTADRKVTIDVNTAEQLIPLLESILNDHING